MLSRIRICDMCLSRIQLATPFYYLILNSWLNSKTAFHTRTHTDKSDENIFSAIHCGDHYRWWILWLTRCQYSGYVSEGGAYNSLQYSKLSRSRAAAATGNNLSSRTDIVQQHYLDNVDDDDDDDRLASRPPYNNNNQLYSSKNSIA